MQNPFDVLGCPRWAVAELRNDIPRLRKLIGRYYRALAEVVHSDAVGGDTHMQHLNIARGDLADDEDLLAYLDLYLGSVAADGDTLTRLAERNRQREQARLAAAAGLLGRVDSRYVMGEEPCELLVERPDSLPLGYHLLRFTGGPSVELLELRGDKDTVVLTFPAFSAKDNAWRAVIALESVPESLPGEDDAIEGWQKDVALTEVKLADVAVVGAVALTDVEEVLTPESMKDSRLPLGALVSMAMSALPAGQAGGVGAVDWITVGNAPWLAYLQPASVRQVPSILVAARGTGDDLRVALVGTVLASRLL